MCPVGCATCLASPVDVTRALLPRGGPHAYLSPTSPSGALASQRFLSGLSRQTPRPSVQPRGCGQEVCPGSALPWVTVPADQLQDAQRGRPAHTPTGCDQVSCLGRTSVGSWRKDTAGQQGFSASACLLGSCLGLPQAEAHWLRMWAFSQLLLSTPGHLPEQ